MALKHIYKLGGVQITQVSGTFPLFGKSCDTSLPHCMSWNCEAKQTPLKGQISLMTMLLGINFSRICKEPQPTIQILLAWALMTLKYIHKAKRKSYLYNVRIFSLYLIWDVKNIPPYKHNAIIMPHEIARRKKPLYQGYGIDFNTICNDSHLTMQILSTMGPRGSY